MFCVRTTCADKAKLSAPAHAYAKKRKYLGSIYVSLGNLTNLLGSASWRT